MVSPFKTGNGLVFQSDKSTVGHNWYLNSSPNAGKSTSVYLSDKRDFRINPGCYWLIYETLSDGIRLKRCPRVQADSTLI